MVFLDFALDCIQMGKFSCASSALCLSKEVFQNHYTRIDLNCTSKEGGLCRNDPCGENGICYEGLKDFYCGCKPGWKGVTCDLESKLKATK